jgi:two-component system, LuxR family, response regulator FixJ
LTPREREILTQCICGASSKEVGRVLGISPRTVEDHRARIMRKLGVKSTVEMVRVVLTASAA